MKKIFFIFFLLATNLFAGDFFLPWKQDSFKSQGGVVLKYDKLEHVLFFAGTTVLFERYLGEKWGIIASLGLGLANEVKDGALDYRRYGKIGGDKFSTKDLIANMPGVVAGHYAKKIIFPAKKKGGKPGWTINISFRCY